MSRGPLDHYFGSIEEVEAALARRVVLGQAQGILMERLGITPDRAHAFLARASQQSNTKIEDVAALLVETRILPRTIAPSRDCRPHRDDDRIDGN